MLERLRGTLFLGVAGAMLLYAAGARADQIDGHWCYADGRNLSIEGATIVTPGGNEILGDYRRHSFSYTVPADEPAPGTRVAMLQLNDLMIHVRPEGAQEPQVWRRCNAPTA